MGATMCQHKGLGDVLKGLHHARAVAEFHVFVCSFTGQTALALPERRIGQSGLLKTQILT